MPQSAKPEREPVRPAHLLPAFDEYFVAYKDRKAAVNRNDAELFMANGGGLGPTIVLEGRVAGTWKRTIDRTSVMISLQLFDL
jgi:Winged helix DNA-binding domain